jgi:hypothetical protein
MTLRFSFSLLINFIIRTERPYLQDRDLKLLFGFFYFGLIVFYGALIKCGVTKNFSQKTMIIIYVINCLQQEFICTITYDHGYVKIPLEDDNHDYYHQNYQYEKKKTANNSLVFYFFFWMQSLAVLLIYRAVLHQKEISLCWLLTKLASFILIFPAICFFTFPSEYIDFKGGDILAAPFILYIYFFPFAAIWMRALLKVIVKKTLKKQGETLRMQEAIEFTFMSPVWALFQIGVDILRIGFLLIQPASALLKKIGSLFVCICEKIVQLAEQLTK